MAVFLTIQAVKFVEFLRYIYVAFKFINAMINMISLHHDVQKQSQLIP